MGEQVPDQVHALPVHHIYQQPLDSESLHKASYQFIDLRSHKRHVTHHRQDLHVYVPALES